MKMKMMKMIEDEEEDGDDDDNGADDWERQQYRPAINQSIKSDEENEGEERDRTLGWQGDRKRDHPRCLLAQTRQTRQTAEPVFCLSVTMYPSVHRVYRSISQ